jgi:hypothetical protein
MATFKHRVIQGESLSKIAQQYGTTWRKIAADNTIENRDAIHPDDELSIDLPDAGTNVDVFLKGFEGLTKIINAYGVGQGDWGFGSAQLASYCEQVMDQVYQSVLDQASADVRLWMHTAHSDWKKFILSDAAWGQAHIVDLPEVDGSWFLVKELARAELKKARIVELFNYLGFYQQSHWLAD